MRVTSLEQKTVLSPKDYKRFPEVYTRNLGKGPVCIFYYLTVSVQFFFPDTVRESRKKSHSGAVMLILLLTYCVILVRPLTIR